MAPGSLRFLQFTALGNEVEPSHQRSVAPKQRQSNAKPTKLQRERGQAGAYLPFCRMTQDWGKKPGKRRTPISGPSIGKFNKMPKQRCTTTCKRPTNAMSEGRRSNVFLTLRNDIGNVHQFREALDPCRSNVRCNVPRCRVAPMWRVDAQ